jgi:hypothetical protein
LSITEALAEAFLPHRHGCLEQISAGIVCTVK